MGSCVRLAHALGMHVNDGYTSLSPAMKELYIRTWWGLYALEGHLSIIVGQPNFINANYCPVPLPLPLSTDQLRDEALVESLYRQSRRPSFLPSESRKDLRTSLPSNSGSYFRSGIQLSILEQKIMVELYSTTSVARAWRHLLQVISRLSEELQEWLSSLPPELNFTVETPGVSRGLEHERRSLHVRYIAANILVTRPCIESPEAMTADDRAVRMCVRAAKELASLLPHPSDSRLFYNRSPWWTIVHHVMQGLVVLLLTMSQKAVYLSEDGADTLPSIKTFLRLLGLVAKRDAVAERVRAVALGVLRDLAASSNVDVSDLMDEKEQDLAHADEKSLQTDDLGIESGQWSSSSGMEHAQVSMQPDESPTWHNLYDQALPASMFEGTGVRPAGEAARHYFAGYEAYDTAFSNPFVTEFGDEAPESPRGRDYNSNR